ncbi:hypothetical protein F5Y18DRAFT_361792 [Xylariaceae sp. FL1019]|nr:hypothetical protein F5Y18DRAFT_361792 [Xylariaceae sp. FL1019]
MSGISAPTVKVELYLSPSTHCFTSQAAPDITLQLSLIESPASTPITLYTEKTPLDIRHALSHRGFTIRDLTERMDVENTAFVNNAMRMANPPLRVRGSAEEKYFITLPASRRDQAPHSIDADDDEEVRLSYTFGRGNFRPQPWSVVQLGHEVDENGNPRNIRRSKKVTGVDGLKPGHEYEIGMDVNELRQSVMWAPVPKEDILLEEGFKGGGRKLDDYPWIKDCPIDFRVGTVKLTILEHDDGDDSSEAT